MLLCTPRTLLQLTAPLLLLPPAAADTVQFYLAPKIDEDEDMGDEVGES
jgi:hypothetical protein